jgi:hypothetical protein
MLHFSQGMDKSALVACPSDPFFHGPTDGRHSLAVNGAKVGSSGFDTLEKVMSQFHRKLT